MRAAVNVKPARLHINLDSKDQKIIIISKDHKIPVMDISPDGYWISTIYKGKPAVTEAQQWVISGEYEFSEPNTSKGGGFTNKPLSWLLGKSGGSNKTGIGIGEDPKGKGLNISAAAEWFILICGGLILKKLIE